MSKPPRTRKTRFVCVSDTHNAVPGGAFKLPEGDVLIHAGDLTNQGSYAELKKAVKWIEEADFEAKIVVAGNHDITLDTAFYDDYGLYFHNQDPQDAQLCQQLLTDAASITYLRHEAATISLASRDGRPHTTFTVFGSPFSPARGMWAFGYGPAAAAPLWERIPLGADVVVTHTPPKYHLDERSPPSASLSSSFSSFPGPFLSSSSSSSSSSSAPDGSGSGSGSGVGGRRGTAGCEALRRRLWRVRPRLAVCGHVHEGRGAERVAWELGCPSAKFKEARVLPWSDPGRASNRLSRVDLTGQRGAGGGGGGGGGGGEGGGGGGRGWGWAAKLQNDGAAGDFADEAASRSLDRPTFEAAAAAVPAALLPALGGRCEAGSTTGSASQEPTTPETGTSQAAASSLPAPVLLLPPASIGQGGVPPSRRCDVEALSGRMGRKETCIVNAAITASSWPHGGGVGGVGGGRRFNKPIVVDVDLPVWDSDDEG